MPEFDDYMVDLDENGFDDDLDYFDEDLTQFSDHAFSLDGNLQYTEQFTDRQGCPQYYIPTDTTEAKQ